MSVVELIRLALQLPDGALQLIIQTHDLLLLGFHVALQRSDGVSQVDDQRGVVCSDIKLAGRE